MKKKILIILLCTMLFVLIGASLYLKTLVNDVNSITPVYVEVEVSVTEHKITNIKIIEHENGLGGKAEKIVDNIISRQSLEVDAVSGATVSSKCIIKAIENALQSGSK